MTRIVILSFLARWGEGVEGRLDLESPVLRGVRGPFTGIELPAIASAAQCLRTGGQSGRALYPTQRDHNSTLIVEYKNFLEIYFLIESDGFTFCAMFRAHKVPWRDVDRFEVTRIVLNKMIVWNYPAGRHIKGRAISKSIAGYEAGLPDTYGFKAEDLCALLNQIKAESLSRE